MIAPSATMGYWFLSLAVLVLGFLTGFSIGAFILPIGVALVVLGPFDIDRRSTGLSSRP